MKDFNKVIQLLEEYKGQYGNLLVPYFYTTENGVKLGRIVSSIRDGHRRTSEEEKVVLNDLGFVWKVKERTFSFEEVLQLLEEYKEQHGNLLIPRNYITESGIALGIIVKSIRAGARKTSEEEKVMLNDLGFVWKVIESALSFEEVLQLLEEYKGQYGNLLVPRRYTTENGVKLGNIVTNIRAGARKTSEAEKKMLNNLGFVWKAKKGRIKRKL